MLVNVVNPHDEIVDVKDIKEVHKNKLLHRLVHILVFDPEGNLFVNKKVGSFQGHVLAGESYIIAATRVLDSVGVVGKIKKLCTFREGNCFVGVYVVKDFKGIPKADGAFVDVSRTFLNSISNHAWKDFCFFQGSVKDFF